MASGNIKMGDANSFPPDVDCQALVLHRSPDVLSARSTSTDLIMTKNALEVEVPTWLVPIYQELEQRLEAMAQFERENSEVAGRNPNLVEEYRRLLDYQHRLFDAASMDRIQLMNL